MIFFLPFLCAALGHLAWTEALAIDVGIQLLGLSAFAISDMWLSGFRGLAMASLALFGATLALLIAGA